METPHAEIIKSESERPTISQDTFKVFRLIRDTLRNTPFIDLPEGTPTRPVIPVMKGYQGSTGTRTGTITLRFIIFNLELSLEMLNHEDNALLSSDLMKELSLSSDTPFTYSCVTVDGMNILMVVG